MTIKDIITARYGAIVHQKTIQLKEAKKTVAKTKNQFIFLQKCVKNKLTPKSLRIKCPARIPRTSQVTMKYRSDLVIAVKNDAKHRFFAAIRKKDAIEEEVRSLLSPQDMQIIQNITEKSREAMFIRAKERLVNKFKILLDEKIGREKKVSAVKSPILDLVNEPMPESHKDLLSLGPKFVPAPKKIPHMDIITTTEAAALKLEFSTKSEKICSAQVLQKDVLRILKNAKPVQDNLSRE